MYLKKADQMKYIYIILIALATFTSGYSGQCSANESGLLIIHFYYTPSCPLCEPTKQVVERVEKKYSGQLKVIRHNHSESEQSFNSMVMALEHYKRKDTPNSCCICW